MIHKTWESACLEWLLPQYLSFILLVWVKDVTINASQQIQSRNALLLDVHLLGESTWATQLPESIHPPFLSPIVPSSFLSSSPPSLPFFFLSLTHEHWWLPPINVFMKLLSLFFCIVVIPCLVLAMSFSLVLVIIMYDYSQESRPYSFKKNELGSIEEKREPNLQVKCYKHSVSVPKTLRTAGTCCTVKGDTNTCILFIAFI